MPARDDLRLGYCGSLIGMAGFPASGSAVVISAEDSFDAIHRRLNRIDPSERRLNDPQRLIIVPLADASGPQPLIAVEAGVPAKTAFFQTLKTQLVAFADLKLVVIDPLQAFVMADVNSDPAAGQYMWTAIAELCAATGATVIESLGETVLAAKSIFPGATINAVRKPMDWEHGDEMPF